MGYTIEYLALYHIIHYLFSIYLCNKLLPFNGVKWITLYREYLLNIYLSIYPTQDMNIIQGYHTVIIAPNIKWSYIHNMEVITSKIDVHDHKYMLKLHVFCNNTIHIHHMIISLCICCLIIQ